MDTGHLAQQVERSIDQLHDLFDEIGVPTNEREARESELFSALSDAINKYLRLVTTEKKDMIEEAKKIIIAIRQMEASLEDSKHAAEHEEFKIAYPLMRCLQALREKHAHVARLHKERYEQVMKLAEALKSYSSHLEPTFVQITLPPTGSNRSIPVTFDLSPSYVDRLDSEFTRVYEEYTRRLAAVQALGEHIIHLWAELGVPQSQQDAGIVKYYRDAPEQLGLHEEDIKRLTSMRDKLSEEKKNREKRINLLKAAVESLWEKLGVDEEDTRAFLNQNRGYGIRQINEFEDELERLNELKRQNLQYFVEDARITLQELWDTLYFSEDEMLEFTPAFSDVYSDALLEAHEREIKRLGALKEQRAPTLTLIAKYKDLIKDRDELIVASQDSSRLMLRGQKGEKRDPGKLLREEKMRRRIAKELPRVTVQVTKALEQWEEEYGKPFLVHGNRYLNELEQEDDTAKRPGTSMSLSKTPANPASTIKVPGSAPARANAHHPKSVPSKHMSKTPSANEGATKKPQSQQVQSPGRGLKGTGSPSKLPARVPLSNLKHGANSPDRPKQSKQQQQQQQQRSPVEKLRNGAPARAPPPKMRALKPVPELEAPANIFKSAGLETGVVRAVEPEDVYDDRPRSVRSMHSNNSDKLLHHTQSSTQYDENDGPLYDDYYPSLRLLPPSHDPSAATRQISSTSHASTVVSGSENWETYDDNSEPEVDVSSTYYSKLRAARGKRMEPEQGHQPPSSPAKRMRSIPAGYAPPVMIDEDGNRVVSGSEWADDETF